MPSTSPTGPRVPASRPGDGGDGRRAHAWLGELPPEQLRSTLAAAVQWRSRADGEPERSAAGGLLQALLGEVRRMQRAGLTSRPASAGGA